MIKISEIRVRIKNDKRFRDDEKVKMIQALDNLIMDSKQNPNYELLDEESEIDLDDYLLGIEIYGLDMIYPFDENAGKLYKRIHEEMFVLQCFGY